MFEIQSAMFMGSGINIKGLNVRGRTHSWRSRFIHMILEDRKSSNVREIELKFYNSKMGRIIFGIECNCQPKFCCCTDKILETMAILGTK